ncbi:MAG: hypothetical protein PUC12_00760, partial [Clostridiales bacterium]|nr:hypothetical protein [Clostridiales bacterium]
YAKYDNVAVRNKMFSLSGQKFEPQRALNQNEKTVCLSVVKEQWNQLNAPITEKDAVEFQDNVIYDELQNITDYSMEMEPDGTYNISISDASNSVSFSENKIILLPGNNENPDGIACKIEAFEERDGIMYIWGRPVTELGDVFENLSLSGTISNLENPVLAEGASFVKETDSDDNSESFDLKYAPEILNVSSSNENAWKIKKSVDVLHPETLTTTQTEVTFTINQPSIDFDFEIRNKKIQELSISMNNEASADISLEGTVTSQIPLIESVEVPLKYGFKLDMALYVIFEAEGKLSYKPVLNSVHKVRLSMDNPTSPQFSKDVSFNDDFELEASLKFGIQPEIMLEWCSCWDIADINAEIGIEFKAKYKHYNHCDSENNNRFRCIDISAQRMFNINFLEKETVVKALIVEFMEKEDFEGFTVKIPDKNKITNHLECKNDEPWEEVVKCTRDEQAYDALGNKIIAASIIFEEYYLEPDSENNLQLNEVTVASYPYSWTPGCKVSVPELNSLLSYDNTFIKCKVTVTTENGVYELSYDALYEEGDNLYYNEFSLEGIDLTTALWLFMGYQCDTDMNENQL